MAKKRQGPQKCHICQAWLPKNGKCNNEARHAKLKPKRTVHQPKTLRDQANQHDISGKTIDAALDKLLENAREMTPDEEPDAFEPNIEMPVAIPTATGGYKAGIPERIKVGDDVLTPRHSLWHHIVLTKDGKFQISDERKAYYREQGILGSQFEGKTPVESPQFTMLGGGPAAGKTTMKESGLVDHFTFDGEDVIVGNTVDVSADDMKFKLPEAQEMSKHEDVSVRKEAAGFVHVESSLMAKAVLQLAEERSYNITLDGTGTWNDGKMSSTFERLRKRGYGKIVGVYCTVGIDTALERAENRFNETGRSVSPEVTVGKHKQISERVPNILINDHFDEITLWQTENRDQARKIISKKKGQPVKLSDKGLWVDFLNKTKYEWQPALF